MSRPLYSKKKSRQKKSREPILQWVSKHKLKTCFLVILLYVIAEILTIPFLSIARLKTENPEETAMMRQRLGEAKDQEKALKIVHRWVPLSQVPKHVRRAIVVAEDGTFYVHQGIDWHEVWESVKVNVERKRIVRGASTITQQVAKNLYLSTSKTPMRKFKELIITFLLESQLSKRRILEIYINIIEWGRGVFGIQAAAQKYFGTSAKWLTRDQAARLAAVIPSPLRYRPNSNNKYVLEKKRLLLRRMAARGRK